MNEYHVSVIDYRLKRARDSIEEATILKKEGMLNSLVMSNLYYAVFYSIMAVLKKKELGTLTHTDIFSQFEIDFIQTRLIRRSEKDSDSAFLETLQQLLEFHNGCECMGPPQVSDHQIEEVFSVVEDLVAAVEKYLS